MQKGGGGGYGIMSPKIMSHELREEAKKGQKNI